MERFVSEHFTPLTLDIKTGVISDEDTVEIWEDVKEVVMEKVRRNKNRTSGEDSILIDEEEVEKSFWFSRPDDWVVNRKRKKIILLEFKRVVDYSESYYRDMRRVTEQQHTTILTGLRSIVTDRGWEVEVVPLVGGQWSVREKECLESFRVFLIGKDDGQKPHKTLTVCQDSFRYRLKFLPLRTNWIFLDKKNSSLLSSTSEPWFAG